MTLIGLQAVRLIVAAMALAAGVGAIAQDAGLPPTYQTIEGFHPGPEGSIVVAMQAGGRVDASHLGEACASWIAAAPDVRLRHTARPLPLRVAAQSAEPVVLLINLPDGRWSCSRSALTARGDHRAELTVPDHLPGRYDIWVGTVARHLIDARLILDEPVARGD